MSKRNRIIALLLGGAGLGGCTSDPAFWGAVAQGLDQAAYDIANEPVCNWYTDRSGVVRQSCAPAYASAPPGYVPDYSYRDPHRRDRDGRRDWDRDRRDRDGDRDGRRRHGRPAK
jgi:hypothetical protein